MELKGYDNWKLSNGYSNGNTVDATVTVQLTDVDGEVYTADFEVEGLDVDVAEGFKDYMNHDAIMALIDSEIDLEWEQHPGQKYEIISVDY